MPNLTIEKTYEDGVTPTSADFDNICDSLETFLNVTKLGADNIADNSITASSTFVAESISADKIQNLAVTTAKIVDNAATAAKFATGAVTTAKILDANVTTDKIAAGAVTSAKLADGAITAALKPVNGSQSVAGPTVTSTGVVSYSSVASPLRTRPILFSSSDSSITMFSNSSGAILESSLVIQKNSVTVVNQEFKAGPFVYTSPNSTRIQIPSTSLFFIDTTYNSSDTADTYRYGLDLTVGKTVTTAGNSRALEII
jgi:hypothetical protein